MTEQPPTTGIRSQMILLFCVLILGIGVWGYLYFESQKRQIRENKQVELTTIAELKANEIFRWREERLKDAAVIAENPLIGHEIRRYREDPSDLSLRNDILTWLESLDANYDYDAVILTDGEGIVHLSTPETVHVDPHILPHLPLAIQTGKPLLSSLHRTDEGMIRICLLAPIFDYRKEGIPVVGVLLLRIDPHRFLYPLIQSWPTPSPSSETLIVRQEGDGVLYLNELRHRKDSAFSLRLPLSEPGLPAAMAVQGKEGIVTGKDYRGAPVLAYVRRIPDSPWYMVTKVDSEEIDAPIRDRAWMVTGVAILLISIAGVVLALLLGRQKRLWLQEANDALDRRVRERTDELVKTRDALKVYAQQLERINRELGEFSFAAAHDLQEPLRKIRIYCSALRKKCGSCPEETCREYFKRMQNAAGQMQNMIPLLHDYSRLASGSGPLRPVSLKKLIEEVLAGFREDRIDADLQLDLDESHRIEADADRMRWLFRQLIDNALKFRGERNPVVRIRSEMNRNTCRIFVEDNGIGFEAKYSERIFRPFERLYGREEYEGSGMGLAICRRIAEHHGGSITAESVPGQGSTFIVTLPSGRL